MTTTQKCSEMKKCPFCGSSSLKFTINIPICGVVGVWGECTDCGARTKVFPISNSITTDNSLSTLITIESILKGTKTALLSWNRRENK